MYLSFHNLLQKQFILLFVVMSIDYLAKKNAHERDSRIVFHEGPHLYEIDGSSDQYVSVTTMNHRYFPHFDADAIAEKMISNDKKMSDPSYKYYGMTKQAILDSWNENGRLASEAGTKMHLDIELYYNHMPVVNESPEYAMFQKFLQEYPHLEAFRTEWTVFYEEAKIAGSIDMVFRNTETGLYEIYDW